MNHWQTFNSAATGLIVFTFITAFGVSGWVIALIECIKNWDK